MEDIAIYVHWPYCARICPYCDFNVYKQRRDDDLVAAMGDDIGQWADWSGPRRVTSVHFGGGTPSLLAAKDIAHILETIQAVYDVSPHCEIAIEANPQDVSKSKWEGYKAAGINRLSLGVQSFHDPALALLGRDHDGEGARQALSLAVDIFPSVSCDLIFGWTGQSEGLLTQDLDIVLSSDVHHISAYQLTIEDGTAFAKAEARGDIKAVGSDQSADFYDLIRARLISDGFGHYEVSNFAKWGHRSRHNLTYWTGGDYIGVGPGAHGRLTVDGKRYATIASMRPDIYKETYLQDKTQLSPTDWAEEYVLMGLRIDKGISMKRFADIGGKALDGDILKDFVAADLLSQKGGQLQATAKGRLVLNKITEGLLMG